MISKCQYQFREKGWTKIPLKRMGDFVLYCICLYDCREVQTSFAEEGRERAVCCPGMEVSVKQKVLLIVPHQDDELFVGGGLLRSLAKGGEYEAYVVYTTNGDFFPHEAEVRLGEAVRVLTAFAGMEESHIFFLGYGDGWKDGGHIYHQEGDEPLVSMAGKTETYAPEGHSDYRYMRSGRHSAYRWADFKRDLKDVLAEVRADLVLVVDFDKHADHRAASLLVEECLGELFREDASYRPLVLKRFAYDGVWKGRADFFELPRRATELAELSQTPYTAEEELRFAMPEDCATPYLSRNPFYRALRRHRTQEAWQKADEIINIDEVFFRRSADNLLYTASLTASSGNPEYLRDFKLFDCGDVTERELVLKECGWKPEEGDAERTVRIRFEKPRTVGRIAAYARGSDGVDRLEAVFSFDTGAEPVRMEIRPDGKRNFCTFAPREGVREMALRITAWEGVVWGITELEILPPEEKELPETLEGLLFHGDTLRVTGLVKPRIKMEKAVLALKRKISRWLPNSYTLRRHYPEIARRERVSVRYRVLYIAERLRAR